MTCPLNLQWLATFAAPRTIGETDMLWRIVLGAEARGFLALDRFERGAVVSLTEAGRLVVGDAA